MGRGRRAEGEVRSGETERRWGLEKKKRWPCEAENGGGVCVRWMNVCMCLCVGV